MLPDTVYLVCQPVTPDVDNVLAVVIVFATVSIEVIRIHLYA